MVGTPENELIRECLSDTIHRKGPKNNPKTGKSRKKDAKKPGKR
jgi:hypothetical protein